MKAMRKAISHLRTEGSQKLQMIYILERIVDLPSGEKGHRMFIGVGLDNHEVCTNFFCAVTGLSRSAINIANKMGAMM